MGPSGEVVSQVLREESGRGSSSPGCAAFHIVIKQGLKPEPTSGGQPSLAVLISFHQVSKFLEFTTIHVVVTLKMLVPRQGKKKMAKFS